MDVEQLDAESAPESDLHALWELYATVEAELQPMLPPMPYDEKLAWLRVPEDGSRRLDYVVRDRASAGFLGAAQVRLDQRPEHAGRGEVELVVRPDARRRGIGTRLLATVTRVAADDGRTHLAFWHPVGSPGDAFLTSFALHCGQVEQRNVLAVTDIDPGVYEQWSAVPAGYELTRWQGHCPEELVDRYAAARRAMQDAPLGELTYAPTEWTAERVRTMEGNRARRGQTNWVTAAIHDSSGEVAGYTEILGSPVRPDLLYQEDTTVVRHHRGHGLGRTVKAANALWVLNEWPSARWIQTWNAAENEHMVRINRELGYRCVAEWGAWEAPVPELLARLESAAEPVA